MYLRKESTYKIFFCCLVCNLAVSITNHLHGIGIQDKQENKVVQGTKKEKSPFAIGFLTGYTIYRNVLQFTKGNGKLGGETTETSFVPLGFTFHKIPKYGFSYIGNISYWKYLEAHFDFNDRAVDPDFKQNRLSSEFFFGKSYYYFVLAAGLTFNYDLTSHPTSLYESDRILLGLGYYIGYKIDLGDTSLLPYFIYSYTILGLHDNSYTILANEVGPTNIRLRRHYFTFGLAYLVDL